MLKLDERLGLGMGMSAGEGKGRDKGESKGKGKGKDLLKLLSHPLYPNIFQLYKKHVAGIDLSGFPVDAESLGNTESMIFDPAQNAGLFKQMEDYWNDYRFDCDLQELIWQNSMGLSLKGDDLETLNSAHTLYMKHLFGSTNQSRVDAQTIKNESILCSHMRRTLANDALLKAYSDSYCAFSTNVAMRNLIASQFYGRRSFFSTHMQTAIDSLQYPFERIVRSLMVEFGLFVMVTIAHRYIEIFPHNTLGRYPKKLGDRVTTDIYKSQRNHALFSLFVEIPYHLDQLCLNSRRIDELWEMTGYTRATANPRRRLD